MEEVAGGVRVRVKTGIANLKSKPKGSKRT